MIGRPASPTFCAQQCLMLSTIMCACCIEAHEARESEKPAGSAACPTRVAPDALSRAAFCHLLGCQRPACALWELVGGTRPRQVSLNMFGELGGTGETSSVSEGLAAQTSYPASPVPPEDRSDERSRGRERSRSPLPAAVLAADSQWSGERAGGGSAPAGDTPAGEPPFPLPLAGSRPSVALRRLSR